MDIQTNVDILMQADLKDWHHFENKWKIQELRERLEQVQTLITHKDCLSCAQSYSADDEDGNMILVCRKNDEDVVVPEDGYCDEWKD